MWEWCPDHWHASYSGAPGDGSAWPRNAAEPSGATRLVRGGSWYYGPGSCRSADRLRILPVGPNCGFVGFRMVCLPQGPSLNP